MKNLIKEIIFRFFVGFSMGAVIGCVVSMTVSAFVGNGAYLPVMPALESRFETQLGAVFFQFILVGLIGVVFAEGGLVFRIEKWSALKQYVVHFTVTAIFYTPFVYICWTPKSFGSIIIMLLNFLFTYTLTYFIQHISDKKDVESINAKIKELGGK